MKIKKKELQEALKIVRPGLGDENLIQQSTAFAFYDNKVITYNDRISVSHPVENLEISGAIKAEELYKLLDKIDREQIDINVDGNEVLIKAGRAKATFQIQEEIHLPILKEKFKWSNLPGDFCECLNFAYPVCSTDMSMLILTCVYVTGDTMLSSDSFRILQQTMESEIDEGEFLISYDSAKLVAQMNPTKICISPAWVHFKTEKGTIISCRTIEGEYPNIGKFFFKNGERIKLSGKISQILERAKIFSKKDFILDERVSIEVMPGKIKVGSKSECGAFQEESPIDYDGEILKFEIVPVLFEHIFKQTQEFSLKENKVQFQGENWDYLVMLAG